MEKIDASLAVKSNTYPGRGIIIGKSPDAEKIVMAYFIMGRSENSRNRIFVEDGDGIRTQAFDENKVTDPSLIIYPPVRVFGASTIITNGDQTNTIYDGLLYGRGFLDSLMFCTYEPDAPNFTPRISAIVYAPNNAFSYEMSILKSDNGRDGHCIRQTFTYEHPIAGEGRYLHTYNGDGDPLPSFEGEPILVSTEDNIDDFTSNIWYSLNSSNKVSLFVRYKDIATGEYETRIINKNV